MVGKGDQEWCSAMTAGAGAGRDRGKDRRLGGGGGGEEVSLRTPPSRSVWRLHRTPERGVRSSQAAMWQTLPGAMAAALRRKLIKSD